MMQESEVHIQSSDCESAGSQIANDACNLHERPSTTEPLAAGMGSEALMVGIDVGSTTVKAVVLDASSRTTLHATYRRHHAHQLDTVRIVLSELSSKFGDNPMRFALTGSGASEIARFAQACYVQEVVANAIAVQDEYPQVRCAIELGGQDAKMVFFEPDAVTGALSVSDMRMNGSCAGGTGAFLDEIASLLKVPVEQLNQCAARGTTLYSISGRCGVYAKTDIQPLINQGVTKEDIALSTFHAVAKQTLGGLAQGLDVRPPVIFEGGPLTFNPKLVDVFVERLKLEDGEAVVPRSPETIVARGAALSLAGMYAEEGIACSATDVLERLKDVDAAIAGESSSAAPFFETPEQLEQFKARHALHVMPLGVSAFSPGQEVNVYLGIDSGSTTTKFALLDEAGELVDSFYAPNDGEPLEVATRALAGLAQRYRDAGVTLNVLGCATTGYGELLFARAFNADCHVVETVSHALAAARYVDDATFILDIGGQDMKAIWLSDGIVTDILVNEACSSGCGSFLENFAATLGIATKDIADAAFSSTDPAVLGSRCTVFMNSSVVTEQRNGKSPADIMAGLCRSIIANVFTKVIRASNLDSLGERIVVQGGTFANDAVLAAFEDYVGRPVTRAPYPGLMGAIGAALYAQRFSSAQTASAVPVRSGFIGFAAMENFSYSQEANMTCPFCANACNRTIITFANGSTWVTGNRCERGEIVGDAHDERVREAARAARKRAGEIPNLYELRSKLLFADYDIPEIPVQREEVIGLPRVLSLWDSAPFWTTFFRALGFRIKVSHPSTRAMYEDGLPAVASDTVCFPAKLVHGHVRDLAKQGVSRIFMPIITTVPSENSAPTSESMCAVVKGYPLVIRNSDNPDTRFGVLLDTPLFHWYSDADRLRQLSAYMREIFGIARLDVRRAIKAGDAAMAQFRSKLVEAGTRVLVDVQERGAYAIVLASRPYHNDSLVNHDLPKLFTAQGVPVIPADALPNLGDVDLSLSRLDIVNNYHARMLASAIVSARSAHLEYAQVVSFGCGHDAYLSDEIVRLTHQISDKSPLVLKVDESDATGPLAIRVRSFVEAVNVRRADRAAATPSELTDPYPTKFTRGDRRERVLLIPNTSHAFSKLLAAAFSKQGVRAVPMPIGRERAIELGKRYVHNDICFPAQIVIGEALAELESGKYNEADVAIGTGKYVGDCRLTHYAALLRKALDDAGYNHVPIITNDDVDSHNLHPGFKLNALSGARIAYALPMIDALEELLRKIRPYELVHGSAQEAFDAGVDAVVDGLRASGMRRIKRGFKKAIALMNGVKYDRSTQKPRVLIVGEYLLNFHPGANHDVERYLEDNGFEVIEARMADVIRKTYFYKNAQIREYGIKKPFSEAAWYDIANRIFEHAHDVCDAIASAHPLYEPPCRMPELVKASDPIIHHTFDAGEGVLIPAEILHHAAHGCEAFLILQPFGCLPNHIVGRGIAKRLKEIYPSAQILPLDYDPDVSFANVENRLQMLVMNVRAAASCEERASARAMSEVAHEVMEVASSESALMDETIAQASYRLSTSSIDGPFLEWVMERQHEVLGREDDLVARARELLAEARLAAQESNDEITQSVEQAALHAYELADKMRTRTRQAMIQVNEYASDLMRSGDASLAEIEKEIRTRTRAGADSISRMSAEARRIISMIASAGILR